MSYVAAALVLVAATLLACAWLPAPAKPVRIYNAVDIARPFPDRLGFR